MLRRFPCLIVSIPLLGFGIKEIPTPKVTTTSIDALLQVWSSSPHHSFPSLFCFTLFAAHGVLVELLARSRVYRCAILQLKVSCSKWSFTGACS
jgi:hypothetical protein